MTFDKGIAEAIGSELYSLVENLKPNQRKQLERMMSPLLDKAKKGFDNVDVVYDLSKKKLLTR